MLTLFYKKNPFAYIHHKYFFRISKQCITIAFTQTKYLCMKFQVDKRERLVIVKLNEEKLLSNLAPQLKSELVILNNEGFKNIVLDLADVQYVDSSGLSALLVGNRLCKESSGTFVLTGLNAHIQKLIKISQLEPILNIVPSINESVDYVMMEELDRDLRT